MTNNKLPNLLLKTRKLVMLKKLLHFYMHFLLLLFLIFTIKCSEKQDPINDPPVISGVSADPQSILINEQSSLSCNAVDDEELSYNWDSNDGLFPNGKVGNVIQWQAPNATGEFNILVTVSDGEYQVIDSVQIIVEEIVPDTLMEMDFMIPNSNIYITMVRINPSPFYMGSPGTPGAGDDEGPRHLVDLTKAYWIGKYEVTQEQWQAVKGTKYFTFPGAKKPADNVSWYSAKSFINTLNVMEQDSLWRLPTEAEWEYACRGGYYDTRFWYGEDLNYIETKKHSWNSTNSGGRTHNVGTTTGGVPNPYGLWDMGGNVWEWNEDWYHWGYAGAPTDGSAWIDPPGNQRILRGGSFWEDGRRALPNLRSLAPPNGVSPTLGFRLVRDVQ